MQQFEKFYPCEGQEFKATMQAFAESELFPMLASRLYPSADVEAVRRQICALDDVDQFQQQFMYAGTRWVIDNTMSGFTYGGEQHLDGTPSLFISNHRDIVLDAMLLQYILVSRGQRGTHVVVGSNLYEMPLMAALARANKMMPISRGGTPREYYASLMEMSAALRHFVVQRGESAWIAQRNGRTKDGCDRTDPALLKMIAASDRRGTPAQSLEAMHIVPVSISYEWEPCALLKARELALRQLGPYVKAPGEDTQSIVTGVTDYKGAVHIAIGEPLTPAELQGCGGDFNAVARLLDARIQEGYRLYPNNHCAYRLAQSEGLEGFTAASRAVGAVTPAQEQAFRDYLDDACRRHPDIPALRQRLITLYASPLLAD